MNRAPLTEQHTLWLALALSLGAAVSLGVTRFAYGLLLPTMRTDLGWSYTLAGAMNTANALGYLLGALATPRLMQWLGPARLLLGGALLASVFMVLSGFFVDATPLLVQRLLAGVASAFVFIAGGLLAAQQPQRSGFLLGLYYGGTGFGIVLSALLVPVVLEAASARPHGWAWAWWALAHLNAPTAPTNSATNTTTASEKEPSPQYFAWPDFSYSLAGYTLFGVGYIGYMTFVIALLREQGASASAITLFYALLGVAVVLSSRIWAGLLDRFKGGQALAILNGLLGVATVLPALTSAWPVVLASGLLFGGVFLSVVASTTALVRHNLPAKRLGDGHQRVHGGVCGRADCGADHRGADCRRTGWPVARAGVFSRGAVGGGRAGVAATAPLNSSADGPYLIRPSAFIAAITAGRAPTRSR